VLQQVVNSDIRNILLVRTDRIGDLILSLPLLPALKRNFPGAKISMLVRQYTRELVAGHSCVDEILIYEHEDSIASLWGTLRQIRSRHFDLVIIPYPRLRITTLMFLAGIPVRVGTGYRWYSVFFNRRVFEHRKDAKRHEVEYNLNLLKAIHADSPQPPQFEFNIPKEAEIAVEKLLLENEVNGAFAVLHPGSGGSAREWSPEKFSALGDMLHEQLNFFIVITGSENERVLVEKVTAGMNARAVNAAGKLSLRQLGALYKRAAAYISNSTGPLHIAAIVGTPVVALYPPMIQCSPRRWGPYTTAKKIFTADNKTCPLCRGGACQSNVCMEQISVQDVFTAVTELLRSREKIRQ
ncbi:MAG: glycosyltransferase family 9 protein, partial [Bacteroidota bacterium]|nr:glycosyltransferase family 9 protein [Bacteroidota bacterium]